MFTIKLAWPDKALWPNGSKPHWTVVAKAKKAARTASWAAVLEAGGNMAGRHWKRASLAFKFHPKTRATPDRDNCISSQKATQDGIADALFMNDKDFVCTYEIGEPVKGGLVVVTIKEMEE